MTRLTIRLTALMAAILGAWMLGGFLQSALAQADKAKAHQKSALLEGTWEQMDIDGNHRVLMIVTKTHFVSVVCGKGKKTILSSAGGRWSLKDDVFTEHFEFASADQEDLVGKQHTSKVAVEPNKLTITRLTSMEYKQVWKRLK